MDLRARLETNRIPMQTLAVLAGAQTSEVSRLVNGRGRISPARTAVILRALKDVEEMIADLSPLRLDLSDVNFVRQTIDTLRREQESLEARA